MKNKDYFLGKGKISKNKKFINISVNKNKFDKLHADEKDLIHLTIGEIKDTDESSEFTHYVGLDRIKQKCKEDDIREYHRTLNIPQG
jgi:tRNA G10  N-methylase Trm11